MKLNQFLICFCSVLLCILILLLIYYFSCVKADSTENIVKNDETNVCTVYNNGQMTDFFV